MEDREFLAKQLEGKTQKALGIFLFLFGCIVLFSIFFTYGAEGKWINFFAGSLISLIGIFMFVRGYFILKKQKANPSHMKDK